MVPTASSTTLDHRLPEAQTVLVDVGVESLKGRVLEQLLRLLQSRLYSQLVGAVKGISAVPTSLSENWTNPYISGTCML